VSKLENLHLFVTHGWQNINISIAFKFDWMHNYKKAPQKGLYDRVEFIKEGQTSQNKWDRKNDRKNK
jgi:hypothetical protein